MGSINALDCLLAGYLMIGLTWLIKKRGLTKLNKFFKARLGIFIALLLLILGLILAWLVNSDQKYFWDGLGTIKSFYILPIGYALITSYLIKIKIIKVTALLNCLIILTVGLVGMGLFFLVLGQVTYDHRLSGFFASPNQLALILMPGLLVLTHKLIIKNPNRSKLNQKNQQLIKINLIIIGLGFLIVLIATRSSGAWAALLVCGVYQLLYLSGLKLKLKHYKMINKLMLVVIIGFSILLLFSGPVQEIYNYSAFENKSSFDSRLVIYEVSGYLIANNWLFGIGANGFQAQYLNAQNLYLPFPQWAVPNAHNNLLTVWLETGILGLFGFIYLIAKGLQSRIKNPGIEKIILIYFLIHGLFETSFWKNDLAIIFFLFLMITIINQKNQRPIVYEQSAVSNL
ncbi:MAG: hypothetical protein GF332_00140 [Candidatus Moranbacteria bacterium]|nr:hypothetical protein [Candidatus Moranbacteria bacterium]